MASETKRFRSGFWLLCLAAVAAVAGYFGYQRWQLSQQDITGKQSHDDLSLTILHLKQVVDHKLAPEFKDADGDLVADTPADPSKQIDPDKLTFSYVATGDPEIYKARWKDFTEYLSKTTGKPVEYLLFTRTDDEILAIRNGSLMVAGLNTGAVPKAVNTAGFVPAYTLGPVDKGPMCQIIVPADSPITKPEDLKGKTLTFVDMNSNTGYKVPVAVFNQVYHLLPERDFAMRLSYGHEASISGIATHQFEAAAVASDMLDRAIAAKAIGPGDFHIIFKSEKFPTAAMGYAYNLKPELQEKIRKAFETYPWPEGPLKQEFSTTGQDKFTPTNYKKEWENIRIIDNASGAAYN